MIKVQRLRELLAQVPGDADVFAYEGEDVGLVIRRNAIEWFIRMDDFRAGHEPQQEYTEGFTHS